MNKCIRNETVIFYWKRDLIDSGFNGVLICNQISMNRNSIPIHVSIRQEKIAYLLGFRERDKYVGKEAVLHKDKKKLWIKEIVKNMDQEYLFV